MELLSWWPKKTKTFRAKHKRRAFKWSLASCWKPAIRHEAINYGAMRGKCFANEKAKDILAEFAVDGHVFVKSISTVITSKNKFDSLGD